MRRSRPASCRNFLRLVYTQLRLFRCRAFLVLSICLVSFGTVFAYGVILTRCGKPYPDPNLGSPIVREPSRESASWDHRFHRKELSLHGDDSNLDVTLLVLIHASGNQKGRNRRDVIRKTWISDIVLNQIVDTFRTRANYKFVLGGKDISRDSFQRLSIELKQYNDMIILDDVTDEHETLTSRTINSFTYIMERGYEYEYILKCDDDTFVDLKAVMSHLVNRTSDIPLHWGSFAGGYEILSEGPYAENAWYVCDSYIPYAFGGGYVVSRDLIELLASNAPYLRQYNNEDVSLAAWLAPYNIDRMHDLRFDTEADSNGCMWPYIVAHKISIAKMKEYFISMQTEGIICGERTRTHDQAHLAHYYDWRVLPVKDCCSSKKRITLGRHQPHV